MFMFDPAFDGIDGPETVEGAIFPNRPSPSITLVRALPERPTGTPVDQQVIRFPVGGVCVPRTKT